MDAVTVFEPHPCAHLRPGETTWAYCERAMDRVDHLYQPGKTPSLKCLCPLCNPEKEQEAER